MLHPEKKPFPDVSQGVNVLPLAPGGTSDTAWLHVQEEELSEQSSPPLTAFKETRI